MGIVAAALALMTAAAAKVDLPQIIRHKPRRSRVAERLEAICERVIIQNHRIAALERELAEAGRTIALLQGTLQQTSAELLQERRTMHDDALRLYQQQMNLAMMTQAGAYAQMNQMICNCVPSRTQAFDAERRNQGSGHFNNW